MAANAAIIVVAVLLCTVIVKNYLIDPRSRQTSGGDSFGFENLSSIGVDWKQTNQTLVLALSTGCHFCTDSAPFYRQLASAPRSTRLIVVLPQPVAEGRDYLKSLGVNVDDVKQVQFSTIKISGTPTLLLVNADGLVTRSWFGKLAEEQQKEVLKAISSS